MDNIKYAKLLISKVDERKEFSYLEDGFLYYFPSGNGALQSHELRIIADELDKRNKEWEEKVTKDLEELYSKENEEPLMLHSDSKKSKLILIFLGIAFWILIVSIFYIFYYFVK
jgi:hypothetical protein